MKWQFRSTSPEDGPSIAAFLAGVFGMAADHPGLEPRQMYWKYWEPWGDWEGSRSYVLTREDEIVAHGAVVPLILASPERRVRVVRIIDWASNPKAVGSGVILMKRIGEMTDAVMAVGGTEMTLKVFTALRAKDYGHAWGWVRPLRPLNRFSYEPAINVRSVARLVRAFNWSLRAPSAVPAGWSARRIESGCVPEAGLPLPVPSSGSLIFERSAAGLEYYLKCPTAPMELYAVSHNDIVRGWFLLALVGAQARIAESWISSTNLTDWDALHLLAVDEARRHPDVAELFTMSNGGVTGESLAHCGFHRRDSSALSLVDYSKQGLPDGKMRVQMLEGDAAYLHDGTAAFAA